MCPITLPAVTAPHYMTNGIVPARPLHQSITRAVTLLFEAKPLSMETDLYWLLH